MQFPQLPLLETYKELTSPLPAVRSAAKGEQILSFHPEYAGKLDFVVVSDYAAAGTWDKTFQEKEFDYVIHTAAPLLDDPKNTDFVKHFLEPSVDGYVEDTSKRRGIRLLIIW